MTETFDLRQSVKDKLDWILSGKSEYVQTMLRFGPYRRCPGTIYAPPHERRNRLYRYNSDELAHMLSLHVTTAVIRRFIITGQTASYGQRFLSHIYYPARQTLAVYLYPLHLDRPAASYSEERQLLINPAGLLPSVMARSEGRQGDLSLFLLGEAELSGQERVEIEAEHRHEYEEVFSI